MKENSSVGHYRSDLMAERAKARENAIYIHLREEEEEKNFLVHYVRDPEDPTIWKRKRIREWSAKEKAKFRKNPKRKLL